MNDSKLLRAAFILLAVWLIGGNAASGATSGKNYVVLFAGSNFPDSPALAPLEGTVPDMRNLDGLWIRPQLELAKKNASAAKTDAGLEIAPFEFKTTFSEDTIFRLYDDGSTKAPRPTKENFWKAVGEVVEKATKDDVVYVFVATHGIAVGEKSYLCPENCGDFTKPLGKDESEADFANRTNLISVADLIRRLSECKGESVLALDACRNFSGDEQSELEKDSLKEISELVKQYGNVTVLTSCRLGQQSREMKNRDGRNVGAFFYYFTTGLAGAADPQGAYDGRVTLVEAFNYADSRVREYAKDQNEEQTPEWYGEIKDVVAAIVPNLLTSGYDEKSHNYYFTLYCGDKILRGNQKELLDASKESSGATNKTRSAAQKGRDDAEELLTDVFDYVVSAQPGNTTARYLRGYVRRAKADYQGAIEDFSRAGLELTLFVTTQRSYPKGVGTDAYASFDAPTPLVRNGQGMFFPSGDKIVVDQWKNGRLHVVFWRNEECDSWIDAKYARWTPEQASTVVGQRAAPVTGSATPGEVQNIINPTTVNSIFYDGGGFF